MDWDSQRMLLTAIYSMIPNDISYIYTPSIVPIVTPPLPLRTCEE